MDKPSEYPIRKSLRLRGYDYSSSGAYFITLCIQEKRCLLGEVVRGVVRHNAAGQMVLRWYAKLDCKFPEIVTDAVVVMPNHMHCIVFNVGADPRVRLSVDGSKDTGEHVGSPLQRVVQWFKTMTTNDYIRGVKEQDWLRFEGKLWQRNYYEHVIRSEQSLEEIREYIANNPAQWALDRENPDFHA